MNSSTNDAQALDLALDSKEGLSGSFVVSASFVWDDLFRKINVHNFTLTGGSFTCSTFVECDFQKAHFLNTNLSFVTFEKCIFSNVIFEKCITANMKFIDCKTLEVKFM